MKKIIFFILVILSNDMFSQRAEVHAVVVPQGFPIRQLNSKGTSNLYNDAANIASINPASINHFQNPAAGVSYQFETKLETAWLADIGSHRIKTAAPQSAGIIIPYNNFRFAFGFVQVYNATLDIGNIPITTAENPGGIEIFFTPDYETKIYNYTFLISYSIKNFLSHKNELIIGTKYIFSRLNYYVHLHNLHTEVSDNGGGVELGAILKTDLNDHQVLQIGLSFESDISFRKLFSYEGTGIILVSSNDSNYTVISQNFPLTAKTPSRLKLDAGLNFSSQLKVLGNLTEVFWNTVSENVKNQLEFSVSANYNFSQILSSSFGFYYTGRSFEEDFFNINEKMDALFLTAGLEISIYNFDLDLSAADSHLFSGEFREQTIGKIALNFHL